MGAAKITMKQWVLTWESARMQAVKGKDSKTLDNETYWLYHYASQVAVPIREMDTEELKELKAEAQIQLTELCIKYGVQLYPLPWFISLKRKEGLKQEYGSIELPSQLLTYWHLVSTLDLQGPGAIAPIIIAMMEVRDKKGTLVYKGTSPEKNSKQYDAILLHDSAHSNRYELFPQMVYPVTPFKPGNETQEEKDEAELILKEAVYYHELGNVMLAFNCLQLEKLPMAALVKLLQCVNPKLGDNVLVHQEEEDKPPIYGVKVQNRSITYWFNLSQMKVDNSFNKPSILRKSVSAHAVGVKAVTVVAQILCQVTAPKFRTLSLAEMLNNIPGLSEEGSTYGRKPERDHPMAVKVADGRNPIGAVRSHPVRGTVAGWPHLSVVEGVFTPDLLRAIAEEEGGAAPDKYNMKAVVGLLGMLALAMAFYLDENGKLWFRSIHQTDKPSKLGNRGPQARVFEFADAELQDLAGNTLAVRGKSGMAIDIMAYQKFIVKWMATH